MGRDKTLAKISERYYWPRYSDDIRDYCASCHDCQVANTRFTKATPHLHTVPVPDEPWTQIGVDLCALPKTDDGYSYFAIAVDYFSKWVEAEPLKTKDSHEVAYFLYKLTCRLGAVKIQINDQGREFVNSVSAELHALTGVKQRLTSAYHPQSNGLAERNNRTIQNSLLKTLQEEHKEWVRALPGVLCAYNTAKQKSTGYSPHFLMYGRKARLLLEMEEGSTESRDAICPDMADDVDWGMFHDSLSKIKPIQTAVHKAVQNKEEKNSAVHIEAMKNILLSQKRQRRDYEKRQKGRTTFQVGDEVLKWNNRRHERKGGKMAQLPWSGPYKVMEVTCRGTYKVAKAGSLQPIKSAIPASQLKKYKRSDPTIAKKRKRDNEDLDSKTSSSRPEKKPRENQNAQVDQPDVILCSHDTPDHLNFAPVNADWQAGSLQPIKSAIPASQLKKYKRSEPTIAKKRKRDNEDLDGKTSGSRPEKKPRENQSAQVAQPDVILCSHDTPDHLNFAPVNADWQNTTSSLFQASGPHTNVLRNKIGTDKVIARDDRPCVAKSIRGDGNCFYRTLSDVIFGHQQEHLYIRERFVNSVNLAPCYFRTML